MPAAGPSALERLVRILGELPERRGGIDARPEYQQDWAEARLSPAYHYKAGCVDDPAAVGRLNAGGLRYESLEMGATRWLAIVPREAYERRDRKLPLLLVFHRENYDDPFWAMKTLEKYSGHIDGAAQKKDRSLIFIVGNGAPVRMFGGMVTEGVQNYCGDKDRILVDLSAVRENGLSLKQLEGFAYPLEDGSDAGDPDACVELFDGIPALNFCRRWATPWRPHPPDGAGDGTVDRELMIRSEMGRKILEGRIFMSAHRSPDSPGARAYWRGMGLCCDTRFAEGERWAIFVPTGAGPGKLPVVVCLHEVNEPNDHGIVAGFSMFRGFCDVAAQGGCAVIFFAMESPRGNDLICGILDDAASRYPVDLSRVYITGHSHNGHFAQEFARRHPKAIACVAPMGNSPGLPTPAVSHEAVAVDDGRAALMETMDMPTCILCGCKEVGCLVPVNKAGRAFEAGINVEGYAASAEGKIAMWNRRLKAQRCPEQRAEDVLAAASSPCKATRELGFPSDRAETVYIDGFDHYIADLKNADGNFHFRVVAVENAPHMIAPSMCGVAWSYMRRFARDRDSGAAIELL
jgi:poly(3-hydroxybutyrate) depolymerase